MTSEDVENQKKTDDAEVFEFSISEGQLYGPSVPVKSFPDTSSIPTKITK